MQYHIIRMHYSVCTTDCQDAVGKVLRVVKEITLIFVAEDYHHHTSSLTTHHALNQSIVESQAWAV